DVRPPVIVEVGHGDAQTRQGDWQTGCFGHIFKAMVPFILIKGRADLHSPVVALTGQQVEQTVAIEIQGGHTPPRVPWGAGAAQLGHVREFSASVVAKKRTWRRKDPCLAVRAVGDVEVEPSAVGEIDKQGPAALAGSAQVLLIVQAKSPVVITE